MIWQISLEWLIVFKAYHGHCILQSTCMYVISTAGHWALQHYIISIFEADLFHQLVEYESPHWFPVKCPNDFGAATSTNCTGLKAVFFLLNFLFPFVVLLQDWNLNWIILKLYLSIWYIRCISILYFILNFFIHNFFFWLPGDNSIFGDVCALTCSLAATGGLFARGRNTFVLFIECILISYCIEAIGRNTSVLFLISMDFVSRELRAAWMLYHHHCMISYACTLSQQLKSSFHLTLRRNACSPMWSFRTVYDRLQLRWTYVIALRREHKNSNVEMVVLTLIGVSFSYQSFKSLSFHYLASDPNPTPHIMLFFWVGLKATDKW